MDSSTGAEMRGSGGLFRRALLETEAALDWLRLWAKRHRASGVYHVHPYLGHGTPDRICISGHVLEGNPVPAPMTGDSRLKLLLNLAGRLALDDVPAARVRVVVNGTATSVDADDDGFFHADIAVTTQPAVADVRRDLSIELVDPPPAAGQAPAAGAAIVASDGARLGVIVDLDGTAIPNDPMQALRMLSLVSRPSPTPFLGLTSFVRALHAGSVGPYTNPVFYTSSKPWAFHPFLIRILELRGAPPGPLYLSDRGFGTDALLSRGTPRERIQSIDHILDIHSTLPFVLCADGKPETSTLYREVAERHPDRIVAIYLRDPAGDPDGQRDPAGRPGVETVRVPDARAAAEHAISRGFIDPFSLAEIAGDRPRSSPA